MGFLFTPAGNGYFRENVTSFADEKKSTVACDPKGMISSKPVMSSTFFFSGRMGI